MFNPLSGAKKTYSPNNKSLSQCLFLLSSGLLAIGIIALSLVRCGSRRPNLLPPLQSPSSVAVCCGY